MPKKKKLGEALHFRLPLDAEKICKQRAKEYGMPLTSYIRWLMNYVVMKHMDLKPIQNETNRETYRQPDLDLGRHFMFPTNENLFQK